MMKVAVVGAGAAGLCCARHLSRYQDHFQFQVLERMAMVGGTWVYSPIKNAPSPLASDPLSGGPQQHVQELEVLHDFGYYQLGI